MKGIKILDIGDEDICCTIGVNFAPYKVPIECDCIEENE